MPVIRVWFNQPVSAASVAEHLFFTTPQNDKIRPDVASDPNYRNSEWTVGRLWLVSPRQELPLDTSVQLQIEPGLVSLLGPLPGNETRTVVLFDTFPPFTFLGVRCTSNSGQNVLWRPGEMLSPQHFCNPLDNISPVFSDRC